MSLKAQASAQPNAHMFNTGEIELGFWEWNPDAAADAPVLFFAHATGFHARVFDAIIEAFPHHRAIAVDLRGHGRSSGGPIDDWRVVAGDVAALANHLALKEAVGIGHSMGAHILVECAAQAPETFRQLILFDPVILAPELYGDEGALAFGDEPHPAMRRKRQFESVDQFQNRFANREPYSLFASRVFADYCRHALVTDPAAAAEEPALTLACSPETEASVYSSSRSNAGIYASVEAVSTPVLVVRAKQTSLTDFKGSPTNPGLAERFAKGRDCYRPDMTHFHPFEDPGDAAALIRAEIETFG